MALIALSPADAARFAAFLEQEAVTQEGIASKLLEVMPEGTAEAAAKKYRTEALAFRVTAQWLRSWETG